MKKYGYIAVFLFLFLFQEVFAQDPVFTQFYAVPMMTNPAFAGSEGNTRLGFGYRNQWMRSSYDLSTFYMAADKYIESINSGVGISVIDQNESLTGYNYLQVDISYSFHIQISDHWTFFPGLSLGYGFKQFDLSNLILGDQIDIGNGVILPGSSDPFVQNDNVHFFDISAGGIFYHEKAWIGASVKHLTRPDIAFTDQDEVQLEMFLSVHGGYRWSLYSAGFFPEDTFLFLTANYMNQGVFNRLDLGTEMQISGFYFGVLVSGTVQKMADDTQTLISVNPMAGLEFKKFRIGISYDFPVGDYAVLKGTGEITFQYYIRNSHRRKRVWQVKY